MSVTRRFIPHPSPAAPDQPAGQALVEYAVILMLVALALVAALGAFGGNLGVLYDTIVGSLPF